MMQFNGKKRIKFSKYTLSPYIHIGLFKKQVVVLLSDWVQLVCHHWLKIPQLCIIMSEKFPADRVLRNSVSKLCSGPYWTH
jgi:hypothetical protein